MCYKHKLPKFKVIDFQPTVTTSKKRTRCVLHHENPPQTQNFPPQRKLLIVCLEITHIFYSE